MGTLLGALRVLGPVFRLMGRYRAATVVSLILAVGWLVVGLGGRSDASTGEPVTLRHPDVDPGGIAFGIGLSLAVTLVVIAAACYVAQRITEHLHRGHAVRRPVDARGALGDRARRLSAGRPVGCSTPVDVGKP
jgi:hypothetical protein